MLLAVSRCSHTWNSIFVRSRGDTHVRDTAPATPPAVKFFIWLSDIAVHRDHCASRTTARERRGEGKKRRRGQMVHLQHLHKHGHTHPPTPPYYSKVENKQIQAVNNSIGCNIHYCTDLQCTFSSFSMRNIASRLSFTWFLGWIRLGTCNCAYYWCKYKEKIRHLLK